MKLLLASMFFLVASFAHADPVCGKPEVVLPHANVVALVRWDMDGVRHVMLLAPNSHIYVITMPSPDRVCVVFRGSRVQFNAEVLRQVAPEGGI
ncbi:MAG: hypothetical protein KGZ69_15965 [Methylomonas sp.]|nr:hypothetical protein [Methylomonas sp.]